MDFSKFIDLIDFGVIEVWDYFSEEYLENRNSYDNFCSIRDSVLGKKTFDRILMPLPKSAEDFLDDALLMANKGTIIHFYDFLNEALGEIPSKAIEKIDIACKRNNVQYKVLNHVKCGDQAPYVYRVCVDFEIV
jgi:tRNA G37 N-methylase Trm5